jgi:nitric oxide synthase oxygenase domain/subunit
MMDDFLKLTEKTERNEWNDRARVTVNVAGGKKMKLQRMGVADSELTRIFNRFGEKNSELWREDCYRAGPTWQVPLLLPLASFPHPHSAPARFLFLPSHTPPATLVLKTVLRTCAYCR